MPAPTPFPVHIRPSAKLILRMIRGWIRKHPVAIVLSEEQVTKAIMTRQNRATRRTFRK